MSHEITCIPLSMMHFLLLAASGAAALSCSHTLAPHSAHQHGSRSRLCVCSGASGCWAKEQGLELLLRFADHTEPFEEKQYAFQNLLVSQSLDNILDAGLDEISAAAKSPLAKRRLPFRLPSKRAALGCYGRLLAEMASGRLQINGPALYERRDETEAAQERERLFEILSQLREIRGIYRFEGDVLSSSGQARIGCEYGTFAQ